MALQSKTFTIGDFTWQSWSNAYKLDLTVTEESTNISTNRSRVTGSLQIRSGGSNRFEDTLQCDVKLNGGTVASGQVSLYLDYNQTKVLLSFDVEVEHSSDGSLNMSVWAQISDASGSNQYAPPTMTISDSLALTSIPRQAVLTYAPDFTDLDNPGISYSNPAGNSVGSLQACISLDGMNPILAYRDVSKTGSSYTFALSDWERETLRSYTTGNPATRHVYFHLRTQIGSESYVSTSSAKTFRVIESAATRPSITGLSVTASNSGLPSALSGIFVQNKSRAAVTVSASGKYGATIVSFSTIVEGKGYSGVSFTTNVLFGTGNSTITTTVTDSRGFSASYQTGISILAYGAPAVANIPGTASAQCYRSTGSGAPDGSSTQIWIKVARSYSALVSGGVQRNFCVLQWRWKLDRDSWGSQSWSTLIARENTGTNSYDGLISGTFPVTSAYTVQVRVVDDIGESAALSFDIGTEAVDFHLGVGCLGIGRYADALAPKSCKIAPDWTLYIGPVSILDFTHPIGSVLELSGSAAPSVGGSWTNIGSSGDYTRWRRDG